MTASPAPPPATARGRGRDRRAVARLVVGFVGLKLLVLALIGLLAWLTWAGAAPGSAFAQGTAETGNTDGQDGQDGQAIGLSNHDTSLPIDVGAERLVVEQEAERAVFEGDVRARQGELSLRADRVVVLYALDGAEQTGQPVRRVEVEGDVLIAAGDESAKGERGFYDVTAGTVELEGGVVLTSGESVIEGAKLTIDLRTGVATVAAAPSKRVRALFTPQALSGDGSSSGGER